MQNLSILVMSCDKYSDLWEPFAACFRHFWSGCGAPVYLVSETLSATNRFYTSTIKTQSGLEWSERLHEALRAVDTEFVLLLLDDFLLSAPIDGEVIESAMRLNAGCVRLTPDLGYDADYQKDGGYGVLRPGRAYRVSTVPGIWDRKFLFDITEAPLSAWDFEKRASFDKKTFEKDVVCTKKCEFKYAHAVKRGKWQDEGINLCEN